MQTWDNLQLFLAVARKGTLTEAARGLELNASTLHRRLNKFEEELSAKLFAKGPRGYQLTGAGEALLPHAEEVEEAVLSARRAVTGHDQSVAGEVRVTAPLVLLPVLAPHIVAFSKVCPGIKPIVQPDDGLLDLAQQTDIAFRATSSPELSAVGRKLFALPWCRYANVDNTDPEPPWIHYIKMDQHPVVVWRKKHFPQAPIMSVQSVLGMKELLLASFAQGLLPCIVGDQTTNLKRLGTPLVHRDDLWFLVHADLRRAARVRALIDFIVPRLLTCARETR